MSQVSAISKFADIKYSASSWSQYTQHIECCNELFVGSNIGLTFDTYFENDSCTDFLIHDRILRTYVLPEVCVDIVFGYLPNRISVECLAPKLNEQDAEIYELILLPNDKWTEEHVLFWKVYITIDNYRYEFDQDICIFQSSDNHKYITSAQHIDFYCLTQYIVGRVEYTSDYDVLLKNINNVLICKGVQINDVLVFLKIMCSILYFGHRLPICRKQRLNTPITKTNGVCIVV